jgi:hypothetical protein
MHLHNIMTSTTAVAAATIAALTRTPRWYTAASSSAVAFTSLSTRHHLTTYSRSMLVPTNSFIVHPTLKSISSRRWMSELDKSAMMTNDATEERTDEEKELIKAAREAKK